MSYKGDKMLIIIVIIAAIAIAGIVFLILALTDEDFRSREYFEEKRTRRRERDLNAYKFDD